MQTGSVLEYQRKFIETAAPLDHVSEDMLLGQFLNGLRDDLKAEVRLLTPVNLEQAMELALRVEERNSLLAPKRSGLSWSKSSTASYTSKGSIPPSASLTGSIPPSVSVKNWALGAGDSQSSMSMPKLSGSNLSKVGGEVRQLSEKELQDKRAKGLCFKCDDKWVAGHCCKRRELSVLLMDDEDEDHSESAGSEPPPSPTDELVGEGHGQAASVLKLSCGVVKPKDYEAEGSDWRSGCRGVN